MDESRLTALDRAMTFCSENDIADADDMLSVATRIHGFLSPPSNTPEK